MRRDDELDVGKVLLEPESDGALPGGVKVDVNLVDEDDAAGEDDRRVVGVETLS